LAFGFTRLPSSREMLGKNRPTIDSLTGRRTTKTPQLPDIVTQVNV